MKQLGFILLTISYFHRLVFYNFLLKLVSAMIVSSRRALRSDNHNSKGVEPCKCVNWRYRYC